MSAELIFTIKDCYCPWGGHHRPRSNPFDVKVVLSSNSLPCQKCLSIISFFVPLSSNRGKRSISAEIVRYRGAVGREPSIDTLPTTTNSLSPVNSQHFLSARKRSFRVSAFNDTNSLGLSEKWRLDERHQ